MALTFGPGGNSESWGKRKFPADLPAYLSELGLNGYEIECGRGVRISQTVAELLPKLAKENGIYISLHTPYYISLSSEEDEIRDKSIEYIVESAKAAKSVGAEKIIVHSGSCAKISRETALELAINTLTRAQKRLDEEQLSDIIICPETMGKMNQLGTLEEVIEICAQEERFLPCIDFGHLNARTLGGFGSQREYAAALDKIQAKLGYDRLSRIHIHFSKIEYTAGGEKRHLTFDDKQFGPDFEPLMNEIYKRNIKPSIICESAGTQAEDAAKMKKYYELLR